MLMHQRLILLFQNEIIVLRTFILLLAGLVSVMELRLLALGLIFQQWVVSQRCEEGGSVLAVTIIHLGSPLSSLGILLRVF